MFKSVFSYNNSFKTAFFNAASCNAEKIALSLGTAVAVPFFVIKAIIIRIIYLIITKQNELNLQNA